MSTGLSCRYGSRENSPDCSGQPTHRVPGYFAKGSEARQKYGRDLLLCGAHLDWLRAASPFGPVTQAVPLKGRKEGV